MEVSFIFIDLVNMYGKITYKISESIHMKMDSISISQNM